LFQSLEPRRLFAGVTIVTHGFNSNASDWVTAMGNAIAAQSGNLADQPRYMLKVDDNAPGGAMETSVTQLGPPPANWGSGEIVVLLDWSDLAGTLPFGGSHRPTAEVGDFVAGALMSPSLIAGFPHALAELPIHMLGHSRGAGLISEIARGLGQRGVWVDQLTYLDPHPVDGVNDLGFNFGDTPMRVYDNVRYAEDYWRSDDSNIFDFDGEAVGGAYNLQLSETTLSNGGYSIEHSDVHLWYHGTIGPPFADSDGGPSIGTGWYNAPQGPRDQLGWHFSRIARGARPAAGLKTAGAHRDAVALSASGANVWDDISIDNLTADSAVTQDSSLAVAATFEDRSTLGARDSTITLGFDRDDNPYNGVFNSGFAVATSSLGTDSLSANLPTANIAGAFRVYAKIANGTNTRYYYAPAHVVVTVPGYDKTWVGPASGDWSLAANWSPAGVPGAGDRVAIYDSDVTLGVTSKIAGLTFGGTGSIVLSNQDLVMDFPIVSPLGTWTGSTYDGVTGMIAASRLRSSAASGSLTTLGVGEASDVLHLSGTQTGLFSGQPVDSTSVLIKFTYRGDANLDGKINVDDYGRIDFYVPLRTTGWFNGDFNLDGKINVDDYGIIDFNIGVQGSIL
jgi:hypothetical protein